MEFGHKLRRTWSTLNKLALVRRTLDDGNFDEFR
jgi:hypothetical protein